MKALLYPIIIATLIITFLIMRMVGKYRSYTWKIVYKTYSVTIPVGRLLYLGLIFIALSMGFLIGLVS